MKYFFKTLKVEFIKKKKSGIIVLSIIIGAFIPIMYLISRMYMNAEVDKIGIPENLYSKDLSNVLSPFLGFFFPLLIILVASKITQIDHKNKGWNLMETQPTSKKAIYFSKFLLLLISNLIAISTFILLGVLLSAISPYIIDVSPYLVKEFQFGIFLKIGIKIFILSLSISAIQYVISVKIKSFIWPILIGFLMMLLPVLLSKYKAYLFWYPYTMLNQISDYPRGSELGNFFTYTDILSILIAIGLLYIGFNWYRFKTFLTAFVNPKIKLIKLIVVLLITGLLITIVIKPKHQKKHNKTIINGIVETDKNIITISIHEIGTLDTIAKIDVVDGKFHHEIKKKIIPDYYQINFESYQKTAVFFGGKDSLFITYKLFGKKEELKITGNRIAENKKNSLRRFRYDKIDSYLSNNIDIKDANFYMKMIYEKWQIELMKLKSNRTIDNIIPREDFINRENKRINLKYINYWNRYKKIRKSLYPDIKYVVADKIKELNTSLIATDISMLSDNKYFEYTMDELIKKDKRELSKDEKCFDAISNLEKGMFKDRLMFQQLNKSIKEAGNKELRDSLNKRYINSISKKSYRELLLKKHFNINRLSKGMIAPNFIALDKNKKEHQLIDFKGKVVFIDVWATWCAPCLYESPYFEKQALKYKKEEVVFISVSSDKLYNTWLPEVKDKGKSVLHLHLKDARKFASNYDISSIPRFILIDKKGKLIDVNFTRPSNKNFEELFEKYIK